MVRNGFLVVGQSQEVVEAVFADVVVVTGGGILWLNRWSCRRGMLSNLRAIRMHVRVLGLPAFLCDEGLGRIMGNFGRVEAGSLRLFPAIDVTL